MVAVWNRYSNAVEEASRDLGAGAIRTFREVTLPLIWTGLLGAFLFGFTLSWNDYDRTALLAGGVARDRDPAADLVGDRMGGLGVEVVHDDPRSLRSHPLRDRAADAVTGSGDDDTCLVADHVRPRR